MSATLSRFLRDCTERYDAVKDKVATLFEMGAMSAARKADTTVKTGALNFEMSAARLDGEENRYFHQAVCVPAKSCDKRIECARLSLLGKILMLGADERLCSN